MRISNKKRWTKKQTKRLKKTEYDSRVDNFCKVDYKAKDEQIKNQLGCVPIHIKLRQFSFVNLSMASGDSNLYASVIYGNDSMYL